MSAVVLKQTPLHGLHVELGASMVPFAGYSTCRCNTPPASWPSTTTPAQSPACSTSRTWASCAWSGPDAAAALETLMPVDVVGLARSKQRYALLTDEGTIIDDLMFTRREPTTCS